MKRSCFHNMTLMEVIAVLVIVIILITILLPTFVKGREWGRDIKCKGNLNGLSKAVTSYINDNNGYAPMMYKYAVPYTWMLQQGAYINPSIKVNLLKNALSGPSAGVYTNVLLSLSPRLPQTCQYPISYDNILTCPNEAIKESYFSWYASQFGYSSYNSSYYWTNGSHYDIQKRLTDMDSNWAKPTIGRYIRRPYSQVPMIGDGRNGNVGFYMMDGTQTIYSRLFWARHWGRSQNVNSSNITITSYVYFGNARINIGMVDGHVRAVTHSEVWNENMWNAW